MDSTRATDLELSEVSLDRELLSDRIHDLLKQKIANGDLPAGTPLVESRIARQLKVSQSPVRDALRRLTHEGLALRLPRKGTYVAEISIEQAYQAYQVRAALEQVAAAEVARRADEETLSALDEELQGMLNAARRDDLYAFVEHDIAFHRRIWFASENQLLAQIWPMVETGLRHLTIVANRVYFSNLEPIARGHEPLLDALRRRDENVGAIFSEYILKVWDHINEGR